VYIVFKLVTHWRRRVWCFARTEYKTFTDNCFYIMVNLL